MLQAAAGGAALGMPITELALLNAFTLLLWQLKAVQQGDSSDRQSTSVDPALGLGERVMSFCLQLESIFEASGDQQRLQDCIFRIQADVFLVFSSDKLDVGLCPLHFAQATTNDRSFDDCNMLRLFHMSAELLTAYLLTRQIHNHTICC